MTWQLKDTIPQGGAGPRGAVPSGAVDRDYAVREAPLLPEDTALFSWGAMDEDSDEGVGLTQEQERELQWQGIQTAREWTLWGRIARRGIEAVGDGAQPLTAWGDERDLDAE